VRFTPDYRHIEAVMQNRRPERLPLYEHIVSPRIMEKILDKPFASLLDDDPADHEAFFREYCGFFRAMTYDVVTFEGSSRAASPGPHALSGGKGPIQSRSDFEAFPWDEIPQTYWKMWGPKFAALAKSLPEGMKVVGGVANGIFEFAEDVVGLEHLPYMEADDPDLYGELFTAIGDLLVTLWQELLNRHKDLFVACRFGDDLGFKTSLLTNPVTVRNHIVPQYKRIIDTIHGQTQYQLDAPIYDQVVVAAGGSPVDGMDAHPLQSLQPGQVPEQFTVKIVAMIGGDLPGTQVITGILRRGFMAESLDALPLRVVHAHQAPSSPVT